MNNKLEHVYIATFKHGTANLEKIIVVKETAKLYKLCRQWREQEMIVGERGFYNTQIRKDHSSCFTNKEQALLCLANQAERHVENCEVALEEAHDQAEMLAQMMVKGAANV